VLIGGGRLARSEAEHRAKLLFADLDRLCAKLLVTTPRVDTGVHAIRIVSRRLNHYLRLHARLLLFVR
jgi:hypothetical protein